MPVQTAEMRTSSASRHSGDSVRDTVDSLVIAFILSLVFRAFIAEAFIIPTGSMAPTLAGQHGSNRCANCAYYFAFGLPEDRVRLPFGVTCPNCGYVQNYSDAREPFLADRGDRIFVLKWPFDFGGALLGPHRWDAVVFKDPKDGKQNFIKRLVGLPGEVLEIIGGDLYTAPVDGVSARLQKTLLRDPLDQPGRKLTSEDFAELNRVLRIQRKTPAAQSALWQIHYDHDFPPVERGPNAAFWDAHGSPADVGWDASASVVTFDGRKELGERALDLAGKPITDFCGYNSDRSHGGGQTQLCSVGDVRLSFVLTPRAAIGRIRLVLAKHNDEFQADISADGTAVLEHRRIERSQRPRPLATARIEPFQAGRSMMIDFSNVDFRVSLAIDGREVLATTDAQYAPDVAALRKMADEAIAPSRTSLAARELPLTIRHLLVQRDVYYRSVSAENDPQGQDPYYQRGLRAWGTQGQPILLRKGEYFMCGDNSPASKDSRLWWENGDFAQRRGDEYQKGTVPEDQLIGRAFFVYWPSGLRLGERGLAIIPNCGRMRIIR